MAIEQVTCVKDFDKSGLSGLIATFGIPDTQSTEEQLNPGTQMEEAGEEEEEGEASSLMLCNIPCRVSRDELVEALNGVGFTGLFDFVHLPQARHWPQGGAKSKMRNAGYAFVHFDSAENASVFADIFHGYQFAGSNSTKRVVVQPAHLNLQQKKDQRARAKQDWENFSTPGTCTPIGKEQCAKDGHEEISQVSIGVAGTPDTQSTCTEETGSAASQDEETFPTVKPSTPSTTEGEEEQEEEEEYEQGSLMLCNIPCRLGRAALVEAINGAGFAGQFDSVHLPAARDWGQRDSNQRNAGYAFVHFQCAQTAASFADAFQNYQFQGSSSTKTCRVKPAHAKWQPTTPEKTSNHRHRHRKAAAFAAGRMTQGDVHQ